MHTVGGLLGPIGVGDGKTMLDLLAALAMGSKRAVLLIPPALKTQLLTVDWDYYGQHWRLPNRGDSRFFDPPCPCCTSSATASSRAPSPPSCSSGWTPTCSSWTRRTTLKPHRRRDQAGVPLHQRPPRCACARGAAR